MEREGKPKAASISKVKAERNEEESLAHPPISLVVSSTSMFSSPSAAMMSSTSSDGKSDTALIIAASAAGERQNASNSAGQRTHVVIFSRQTRGTCGWMNFEQRKALPRISAEENMSDFLTTPKGLRSSRPSKKTQTKTSRLNMW